MKFPNFFFPRGFLPFQIPEVNEKGLPFEKWDGSTIFKATYYSDINVVNPYLSLRGTGYYGPTYLPSGSTSEYTTVYGPKSLYCVKIELDQLMELFWRAVSFYPSIPTWSPNVSGTSSAFGVTSAKSVPPVKSGDLFSPSWQYGRVITSGVRGYSEDSYPSYVLSNPSDLVINKSFASSSGPYTKNSPSYVYPIKGITGNPASDVLGKDPFGQATGSLSDPGVIPNNPDKDLNGATMPTSVLWSANVAFSSAGLNLFDNDSLTIFEGYRSYLLYWGNAHSTQPHAIKVFNSTSQLWEYWMNPSIMVSAFVGAKTGNYNNALVGSSTTEVGATSEKYGFFGAPFYAFNTPAHGAGWTQDAASEFTVNFNFKDGTTATGVMSAGVEHLSVDSPPDPQGIASASTTATGFSLSSLDITVGDVIDFSP